MKKVITVIALILSVSFSFAQKDKLAEKRATNNTKEMVKVLSLDSDQEAAIYKVNLVKNQKLIANEKVNQSKEEKKANQKEIFLQAGVDFKQVIGLDTMREWWAYLDEKKKNSKI